MKKIIFLFSITLILINLNSNELVAQVNTSISFDYVYHGDTEEKGNMTVIFKGYDQANIFRQENHIVSLGTSSLGSCNIYKSVTVIVTQTLPDQAVYESEYFSQYPRIYNKEMTINVYEELPGVPGS